MIKRIIAISLALILTLSLMSVAFADESEGGGSSGGSSESSSSTESGGSTDESGSSSDSGGGLNDSGVSETITSETNTESAESGAAETTTNTGDQAFAEIFGEGGLLADEVTTEPEEGTETDATAETTAETVAVEPGGAIEEEQLQTVVERLYKYTAEELNARFPRISVEAWQKIQERIAELEINTSDIDIYDTEALANRTITRERAFVVIAKLFDLKGEADPVKQFADYNNVSPESEEFINALINAGYIQGDGTNLYLQNSITWREFAIVLKNIFEGEKGELVLEEEPVEATGEVFKPATKEELQKIGKLTDGQILDLSDYPDDLVRLGTRGDLYIYGNTKIIGANKTISEGGISFCPGEKDPKLTLENVTMEDMFIMVTSGNGTLEIVGACNINPSDRHYAPVVTEKGGSLSITGSGTLNITNDSGPAIYVGSDAELTIGQLTLNASVPDGVHAAAIGGLRSPGLGVGKINIKDGAVVTVTNGSAENEDKPEDIGAYKKGATAAGGIVENCTLNLQNGRLNEGITVGENVRWTGKVHYKAEIKTMDFANANTNSDLYLSVAQGEKYKMNDLIKEDLTVAPFKRGQTDKFDMYLRQYELMDNVVNITSTGTDAWYGESLILTTQKDNFQNQEVYNIYRWIDKDSSNFNFFINSPVFYVAVVTADDTNADSESKIQMNLQYSNISESDTIDCSKYISSFKKGSTNSFYINSGANNATTIDDLKSVNFQILGDDGLHIAALRVHVLSGGDVVKVVKSYPEDSILRVDQWLNQKNYWHKFYFNQDESTQYKVTAKTGTELTAESEDNISYAISDGKTTTSSVWSSHNLSYKGMRKNSTDTFDITFNKAISDIKTLKLTTDGTNGWYIDTIKIQRYHDGQAFGKVYVFEIKGWLDGKATKTYSLTRTE